MCTNKHDLGQFSNFVFFSHKSESVILSHYYGISLVQ